MRTVRIEESKPMPIGSFTMGSSILTLALAMAATGIPTRTETTTEVATDTTGRITGRRYRCPRVKRMNFYTTSPRVRKCERGHRWSESDRKC